jgi:hypothetical protein
MIIKGDHGSLELEVLTKASELYPMANPFDWLEVSTIAYLDIPYVTAQVPLCIELQELK